MAKKRSLYADNSRSKGCLTVINEMSLFAALLRYEEDLKFSHTVLGINVLPPWGAHQPQKMPVNLDIVHSIHILATVPEEYVCRVLKFLPNQRAYLGLTPILHSSLILVITLEEVRLPASRSCLWHFAPVESFFATD